MQDIKGDGVAGASSSTGQLPTKQEAHTIRRPWEDTEQNGKHATQARHVPRPPVPPLMSPVDEQDKVADEPNTATSVQTVESVPPPTARGPNKNVNYKVKFQKARDQYTKAQLKMKKALETLHDAQRKERRLQEEVDYLLDALAARKGDLVKAALET